MSTIVVRDDANGNAIVRGRIAENITNPIVISETATIVITETQKADRCHQRVKGAFIIHHELFDKHIGLQILSRSSLAIVEILSENLQEVAEMCLFV